MRKIMTIGAVAFASLLASASAAGASWYGCGCCDKDDHYYEKDHHYDERDHGDNGDNGDGLSLL